jgi:hypothetical protein
MRGATLWPVLPARKHVFHRITLLQEGGGPCRRLRGVTLQLVHANICTPTRMHQLPRARPSQEPARRMQQRSYPRDATGFPQSGRLAARHHVHREVQELETEFSRGCIRRSRGRAAHTAATFEIHRSGTRKLLQVLFVRAQVAQVFQKKTVKTTPRIQQRTFILAKQGDRDTVEKKKQRAVHYPAELSLKV